MANNYTGQTSLARSPAPAPADGAVIIIAMPADGDDLDADSVQQNFEALADYCTWATTIGKRQYAPLTAGAIAPLIKFTDNANTNVQAYIDHDGGYREGFRYYDNLMDAATITGVGSTPVAMNSKLSLISSGSGSAGAPTTGALTNSTLVLYEITSDSASNAWSRLFTVPIVHNSDWSVLSVAFDVLSGLSGTGARFRMGFSDQASANAAIPSNSGNTVSAQASSSGHDWGIFAVSGGSNTSSAGSIPADASLAQRVRMELRGKNADGGDGTHQVCNVYVNGVLAATTQNNLPAIGTLLAGFIELDTTNTTAIQRMWIANLDFRANNYQSLPAV